MKAIKLEFINNHTVITTETPVPPKRKWFKKIEQPPIIRKFQCGKNIVGNFWEWMELPNKELVSTQLSFQLNNWKEYGI